MKKNIILSILFMSTTYWLVGQTIAVTGKIEDQETHNPIENATIKINNSRNFAITNKLGEFLINANPNDSLIVSHMSYKSKSVKVQQKLLIELQQAQIKLNEIIVRTNPIQDISQSVVIHDDTKKISQPRSAGDLFRDINGFALIKKGSYASEPIFRAFKFEELNVQFDGSMKILNACPNRMDPITTHIIPEEIEKIEIVKGPFTMRFGSNFGGIINLVSKIPTQNNFGLHGSIEGGYETNGSNLVNGASVYYVTKKYDLQVNGSHRDFGDYKDGNGVTVPSSFKSNDYSIKLGFNPSTLQRLQLTWRQNFGRDIKHAGLPMDTEYDNSLLAGVDYKLNSISSTIQSVAVKGFYSYVDHLMSNINRPNFMMLEAVSPVNSTTYGGKAEVEFNAFTKSKIFAGIDANLIHRNGSRTRTVKIMNGMMLPTPKVFVDKIWQDSQLNDIGIFTEGNFRTGDFTTLTMGIRSDFISSTIGDPEADFLALYGGKINSKNEMNISGTVSYKYQKNGFQTQLAIGRGIRTASMLERYINHFTVGVDPYEYVGNPYLKPEVNTQVELSFQKKFNMIKLEVSVFHSFLSNYISAVVNENIQRKFMPTTPPVYAKQFVNISKAAQSGVEFSFNIKASHTLSFNTNVSYVQAYNFDLKEPLAQIPPFSANFEAKYEKNWYWISVNSRFVATQDRISTSFMENRTPGFGVFDARIGFEPIKGFTIGAAVLNIFDKYYYEHLNFSYNNADMLSGKIYEPGRNFTTYLKYSF